MYSRGMFECLQFEDFMEFTFLRLRPAKPNPLTMLDALASFTLKLTYELLIN